MIVNASTIAALDKTFQKIFDDSIHGDGTSPMWAKMATRFPNTAATLDLSWLAAIPGMKKLQGAAKINNLQLINWKIENDEWEDTLAVKLADIERDQLGVYSERLRLLTTAGASHPDELLSDVVLAGFTTKDYTTKNFFDTAKKHFPGVKSTYDNKLTDELAASSFKEARTLLKTMKIDFPDGSTKKLNLGKSLTLVVSPTNEDVARQLLTAETIDSTTNTLRGAAKLEVWGHLGDSPNWFLFDDSYPIKPFAFSDEKPFSLASCTNLNDSHVILNKEFIYQVYGRYAMGYALPHLCIGSTGADAVA